MEETIGRLIDLLRREAGEYKLLLKILTEERQYLIKMKIEEMRAITKKKEKILGDIVSLEAERSKIVREISSISNISIEDLSIAGLTGIIPHNLLNEVKKIQTELEVLLKEVKEANSVNSILIEKTEQFFNKCIKTITTICCTVPVYMSTGNMKQDTKKSGSLVCKKG